MRTIAQIQQNKRVFYDRGRLVQDGVTHVALIGIAREAVPGKRTIVDWPHYLKFEGAFYRRGGLGVDRTNKVTGDRLCTYVPCHHEPKQFVELAEAVEVKAANA